MSSERSEPFKDHVEVHEYAKANGLEYAWEGTAAFERPQRTLSPEQFEVRAVHTLKGITNVGFFSNELAREFFLLCLARLASRLAARRSRRGPVLQAARRAAA